MHEFGVAEEILRAATQVDAPAARRGVRAPVQARQQRVLDDLDLLYARADSVRRAARTCGGGTDLEAVRTTPAGWRHPCRSCRAYAASIARKLIGETQLRRGMMGAHLQIRANRPTARLGLPIDSERSARICSPALSLRVALRVSPIPDRLALGRTSTRSRLYPPFAIRSNAVSIARGFASCNAWYRSYSRSALAFAISAENRARVIEQLSLRDPEEFIQL